MSKDECEKIWEVIFARHRALVRMGVAGHEGFDPGFVHESGCDCISTILGHYDYDTSTVIVWGGVDKLSLNSEWRNRLLVFEKKAVAVTAA